MASVYQRGTRTKPMWYGSVKLLDGSWKAYPTHGNNKEESQKIANRMQQRADQGLDPVERDTSETVGELIESWLATLENRDAENDRAAVRKHIVPAFGRLQMREAVPPAKPLSRVVEWLDAMKAAKDLSSGSRRKMLGNLSRFFGWCVERGHVPVNPCLQLPRKSKSRPSGDPETPRVPVDETTALAIFNVMPNPLHLIYLIGYVSGCRPGEACGLRMSDCAWLDEEQPKDRLLRFRFNRLGPMKERKSLADSIARPKWGVTDDNMIAHLRLWLARREAQGAKGDDLVFEIAPGVPYSKMRLSRAWRAITRGIPERPATKRRAARPAVPPIVQVPAGVDWYSTRSAFATGQVDHEETVANVGNALGHANEAVTRKHYVKTKRPKFPESMRRGLPGVIAPVIQINTNKGG